MVKCVDKNCYFLIDGYPRELEQGIRFEKEVCPCLCVIAFEVSQEIMEKRLLKRGETSGRVDDNVETIKKRFRTFNESTKPVLEYYKKQNKLISRGETSGRVDDNVETIKKRFRTFNESTKPVLEYYKKQNKLISIDASGSVDEIFKEVEAKLTEIQKHAK
ncbi:ATP:UMP phosphotransferase [Fasciola gigantica]|uniref:ATP:UMP phosphotransferase n=1 Tax=Fasciola gigantica TaxID=46835 RepID=A0A504Y7J3_FASGI|nr:ATP:UMP phosphotransferase [Fasciola gigantica]